MTQTDTAATSGASTDYYGRLREAGVSPLWRIPGTTDPEPKAEEVPFVWKWRQLRPLLFEAVEVMDLGDDAERRALNAFNPSRKFGTTHNIVAGYQLVLPGETAPAHRHTPGAIRFMLEGSGHTVVEGEPVLMEPGDLVLTPSMTWHDHRHGGSEPMIWLDGLDVPFVKAMRANFYEDFPGNQLQPLTRPEGDSIVRYAHPGLIAPGTTSAQVTGQHSPLMNYRWSDAYGALQHLAASAPGAPEHRVEYVNPLTGGPVLPTLHCSLTLLTARPPVVRRRSTESQVFCAARGSGYSVVGGTRLDWERNDFFAVPSWTWYEHHPAEESVLFALGDRPLLEPFGLLRSEEASR